MKAYSQDLRERIVQAARSDQNKLQVAQTFQVSLATVKRLVRQEATTGHLTPKVHPGRPTEIPSSDYPTLKAQWEHYPDATLAFHCQEWEKLHGVKVSPSTMSRMLKRLGFSRKKRV